MSDDFDSFMPYGRRTLQQTFNYFGFNRQFVILGLLFSSYLLTNVNIHFLFCLHDCLWCWYVVAYIYVYRINHYCYYVHNPYFKVFPVYVVQDQRPTPSMYSMLSKTKHPIPTCNLHRHLPTLGCFQFTWCPRPNTYSYM